MEKAAVREYNGFMDKLKVALPFTCRFFVIVPGYALVAGAAFYFDFAGEQWRWAAFVGGIALSVGALALGLMFDAARGLGRIPAMRPLYSGVPATLSLLLLVPCYAVIVAAVYYSGLASGEWIAKGVSGGLMLFLAAIIFGLAADGARALWRRT